VVSGRDKFEKYWCLNDFQAKTLRSKEKMKRVFDFVIAAVILVLLLIPLFFVAIGVRTTSKGPVLYWSARIGRGDLIFKMPKFRSMLIDSPAVATHLLSDPESWLTPIGSSLRKSSLDELPQLWSILKGDMSLVGPRPALHNQDDLIALRIEKGIDQLMPGLTGWAQVNGRDTLPIPEKVALDVEYMERQSIWFDMKILWLTVLKVVRRDGVSH
jgi:O-antigen biosynthesis protein WbqP